MLKFIRALALVCAALGGLSFMVPAVAAGYPDKQVHIIVSYPPGGFNDTLARTASQYLGAYWKQSVVVENKPGGNTLIGNSFVARADPDGYTLLETPLPFAALPALYAQKMPYDSRKDFIPIIWAGSTQNVLAVRADSPFKTMQDLLDYARKNPGKVNYGSTGSGSSNHLSMELFMSMTGTRMTHVPYKGSAPAVVGLMGGEIDTLFDNAPNLVSQIRAGKLRALASTGLKRTPLLPDVPTVDELGVKGFEVNVWFGFQAPAHTPPDVLKKINADLGRMLKEPAVIKLFEAQGVQTVGGTPEEFKRLVDSEITKWGDVVVKAGVTLQ
ncbi:MAG TPA: tripartite tricarboxylate transporter substrate binding protein [Bordetella sp.]|jgi:tripartite-type tricarboxylate transporter receptor subunit TctC|nr:tripartite tricarboxylate transporter substrate binding protein [Bordetella sp.]